ncbi:MAG: VOC family protein [Pseudomonadales bacterium]|nr:VOC family protein [Pseudomonadales bacterium]NRA17285.1 VOC family protein [Oceanospirillaceae bacterium]
MNQAVFISPEQVSADSIRSQFSSAMSSMYRSEVPAYGALLDLVSHSNARQLQSNPALKQRLQQVENIETLSDQRHGAIRLGKASELAMMRRIFAIMGMYPVGYYDLSVANVPVHSTAFRAVQTQSIRNNPFRVFTSLLRLELIDNQQLRDKAQQVLEARDIFSDKVRDLVDIAEQKGGLTASESVLFIESIVDVFRWHTEAAISSDLYKELLAEHPLIADVVSFKGPHINHLTPRTLDIDEMQTQIHTTGAVAKAVIEGPPKRDCPILLRQTAFLAIKEQVQFTDANPSNQSIAHAARFGEIEQRGCALTQRGRDLYDKLLLKARSLTRPLHDGSNKDQYLADTQQVFAEFPDDYAQMREQGLGYFNYSLTTGQSADENLKDCEIEQLVQRGLVRFDPITYEDFLPVSAAGIFQSNLGEQGDQDFTQNPNQQQFEADLGATVADEFALYQQMQQSSIDHCLKVFNG